MSEKIYNVFLIDENGEVKHKKKSDHIDIRVKEGYEEYWETFVAGYAPDVKAIKIEEVDVDD